MAGSAPADKGAAERHPYGPRSLAALLPALTGAAFRRRSPLASRLLADWQMIVGPAIAAVTVPAGFRSGVLTISCSGPVALELQHLAPKLIERINIHFGRALVKRLSFRQFAPATPQPPSLTPPPSAETESALAARLAGLDDGPLREALLRLGRVMKGGEESGADLA